MSAAASGLLRASIGDGKGLAGAFTTASAYANNVVELHRTQLNDRDKARQMAANEREIARFLGWQP